MDIEYFKTQINEELEGAEAYHNKAVNTEGTAYSKIFEDMSKQELNHAKNLLDMMAACMTQMKSAYEDLSSKYRQMEDQIK